MNEKEYLIRWSEIEPLCVLRFLKKNLWMILFSALIGAMGIAIAISLLFPPKYTSSATFVVNSRAVSALHSSNIASASEVATAYSQLLQGSFIRPHLKEYLGYDSGSTITAKQLGETNLLAVTVTSSTPHDAFAVIQAIIDHHKDLSAFAASSAVLNLLNSPKITRVSSFFMGTAKASVLAGAGAALAMTAILIWFSISRRTIQTSAGARSNLDAKILTSVPHERQSPSKAAVFSKGKRLRSNLNISSPAISFPFTESIHRIASKFEHERSKGNMVFLFSSVSQAEGKSTLAANTALSLAKKNSKVLFIDLDLRRPVQSELLGLNVSREQELGELLAAEATAKDILDAITTDPNTGMSTLLSTKSYTDMIDLISSPILANVIQLARKQFDYVIIDSPPLGYFADSEQLSDLSDASVLVVRQDVIPAPEINDAIDAMRAGKAEFLGCILNDMSHLSALTSSHGYGYGKKYGQYHKYGYGASKKKGGA